MSVFPGLVPNANSLLSARSYEDNFDAVNNLVVIVQNTDKKSIKDFGSTDKFLQEISYLFGKQAFQGEHRALCLCTAP